MRWTAAAFLLLSSTPAFAQDEIVGARVREWFARMGGVIEADDGSGTSERIDLAGDLGLGDRNLTHELQGYLQIPVVGRLYLGWWHAEDKGSETITRTFDFAGITFTSSTTVESEVSLDVAYLTYEFGLPTIPAGIASVDVGVQLSARALRGKGSIRDSGSGSKGSDDGIVGLPTLGARAAVTLFDVVRAEVEVVGLSFSYGDWRMHYIEAYGEIVARPVPWVFAGLGYKFTNLDFKYNGRERFELDVTVAGLYITAGVRF